MIRIYIVCLSLLLLAGACNNNDYKTDSLKVTEPTAEQNSKSIPVTFPNYLLINLSSVTDTLHAPNLDYTRKDYSPALYSDQVDYISKSDDVAVLREVEKLLTEKGFQITKTLKKDPLGLSEIEANTNTEKVQVLVSSETEQTSNVQIIYVKLK